MGIMDFIKDKAKDIGEWKEEMEEYQSDVQGMDDKDLIREYKRVSGVKKNIVAKELKNRGFTSADVK